MYDPIKDGIEKAVESVQYSEAVPPAHLSGLVDNFWELKTVAVLNENFYLHALPDACVNILFNQVNTEIAGITALRTEYEVLNLGTSFHYVGLQLLPGVWRGDPAEIADSFVGTPYQGTLPLIETSNRFANLDFMGKLPVLSELVQLLINERIIVPNEITAKIFSQIDDVHTVTDMAAIAGVSPRQLQRVLKHTTGFSPHDFLKIIRLQRSFRQPYLTSYADQSHFIHSFRKITGYTPARYFDKFDV